jgi:hypothetical protein
MAMASINIPAMAKVITGMENAQSDLPRRRDRLKDILGGVGVDTAPAARITKVVTWVTGELPGLRRRHALAVFVESQQPGLRTTVSIDESKLPTDPPEVAIRRGKDAAKALKDCHGEPSDDLLSQLEAGMTDPYFAQGFAKEATPEDLARVALTASRERDNLGGQATVKDYEAWSERYERMLTAVGTTIGTATRGTGDAALPSDYAKRWADAITAEPAFEGGDAVPGEGAAAALFLRYGTYSTPFLDTVSTAVYDYEKKHNGDGPLWRPRSEIPNAYCGVHEPDGGHAFDPMASIMVALGNNAEASQHFFSGGGTSKTTLDGHDVQVNSRLKYMLYDRIWPTDDGDALGKALESATTVLRDTSAQGTTSATIASQTIALLGGRIGEGDSGWNPFDKSYQIPTGMTDSVARMVASYMPDVYRVASTNEGDGRVGAGGVWTYADGYPTGYPTGLPVGARFAKDDLQAVLQSLGRHDDKASISMVTAAGLQFQVDLTDSALKAVRAADPDAPFTLEALRQSPHLNLVRDAGVSSGTAMNFLVVNGFQGGNAQQKLDAANRERLAQLFDMATTFVPTPQGKIAGFVVEQTMSQVGERLGTAPEDRATKWATETDTSITESLEYQTYNALLRNGYLDEVKDPRSGLPRSVVEIGSDGLPQIKPYLYQEGGDASRDYNQQEWDDFSRWRSSLDGAPRDQVEPWFITPYKNKFPVNFE